MLMSIPWQQKCGCSEFSFKWNYRRKKNKSQIIPNSTLPHPSTWLNTITKGFNPLTMHSHKAPRQKHSAYYLPARKKLTGGNSWNSRNSRFLQRQVRAGSVSHSHDIPLLTSLINGSIGSTHYWLIDSIKVFLRSDALPRLPVCRDYMLRQKDSGEY